MKCFDGVFPGLGQWPDSTRVLNSYGFEDRFVMLQKISWKTRKKKRFLVKYYHVVDSEIPGSVLISKIGKNSKIGGTIPSEGQALRHADKRFKENIRNRPARPRYSRRRRVNRVVCFKNESNLNKGKGKKKGFIPLPEQKHVRALKKSGFINSGTGEYRRKRKTSKKECKKSIEILHTPDRTKITPTPIQKSDPERPKLPLMTYANVRAASLFVQPEYVTIELERERQEKIERRRKELKLVYEYEERSRKLADAMATSVFDKDIELGMSRELTVERMEEREDEVPDTVVTPEVTVVDYEKIRKEKREEMERLMDMLRVKNNKPRKFLKEIKAGPESNFNLSEHIPGYEERLQRQRIETQRTVDILLAERKDREKEQERIDAETLRKEQEDDKYASTYGFPSMGAMREYNLMNPVIAKRLYQHGDANNLASPAERRQALKVQKDKEEKRKLDILKAMDVGVSSVMIGNDLGLKF